MTTALDSFRDSLNPLAVPPGQIQNITGSTAPCGFIPDVYGNNAYFNSVCTPSGVAGVAATLLTQVAQPLPNGTLYVMHFENANTSVSNIPFHFNTAGGYYDGIIIQVSGYYAWQGAISFTPNTGSVTVTPIDLVSGSPVPISGAAPFNLATDSVIEYPLFQYYTAGRIIGVGLTAAQAGTSTVANQSNNLQVILMARIGP